MVHSGATGLVDDWRTKIEPSNSIHNAASLQPLALEQQTPDRNVWPRSSMPLASTAATRMSPRIPLSFEDTPLTTFTLPRMERGTKVYPGIRDLPTHIRQNFRNEFIRFVIKQVAKSESPWVNPDVDFIQGAYRVVYPLFPARIRHSDAVYHPVSFSIHYRTLLTYNPFADHLVAWGPP